MFLKKRRKYLKPEIIVEDFLEDVTPFAQSPTDMSGQLPETNPGGEWVEEEAKRGFMFDYNNFQYGEDEFDDYE